MKRLLLAMIWIHIGVIGVFGQSDTKRESINSIELSLIQNGRYQELYWNTDGNLEYVTFVVQISRDGKTFETLESLTPKLGKTGIVAYTKRLDDIEVAEAHFRLQVIRKDQSTSYSNQVHATNLRKTFFPLFFMRGQKITVFLTDRSVGGIEMQVLNGQGKSLRTFLVTEDYELNIHDLLPGSYVIHYQNNNLQGAWRFVKN